METLHQDLALFAIPVWYMALLLCCQCQQLVFLLYNKFSYVHCLDFLKFVGNIAQPHQLSWNQNAPPANFIEGSTIWLHKTMIGSKPLYVCLKPFVALCVSESHSFNLDRVAHYCLENTFHCNVWQVSSHPVLHNPLTFYCWLCSRIEASCLYLQIQRLPWWSSMRQIHLWTS